MPGRKRTIDEVDGETPDNGANTTTENSSPSADVEEFELDDTTISDGNFELDGTQINVRDTFSQSMTQNLKKLKKASRYYSQIAPIEETSDNSAARAGIVLKLELHNFMCHEAFSLEFGEQTNFIIGSNGSGKSAVLTGLSVGMGAKANETDRGNSLKGLIMHGKNIARVRITFKNEGPQAFQPDVYGKRIYVERTLKVQGAASFSIKGDSGRVISTKKHTVDEILECYGITIANPMTILTQTDAKRFIGKSSDSDKFKEFMQGTRLQDAYDSVISLEEGLADIYRTVDDMRPVEIESREKYQASMKVYQNFKSSEQYRRKQELLMGKRKWIHVQDHEKRLVAANHALKKHQDELKTIEARLSMSKEDVERLEQKKIKMNTLLGGDLGERMEQAQAERDRHRLKAKSLAGDMQNVTISINTTKEEIRSGQAEEEKLSRQIEAEQSRLQHSTGEVYERLRKMKEEREAELQEIEKKRESTKGTISKVEQDMQQARGSADQEIRSLQDDRRGLESEKRKIASSKEQSRNMVGPKLQNLLTYIESHKSSFRGEVIGPVGLHVHIKPEHKKWGWVLDIMLGRSLNTFLVENFDTSTELKRRVQYFGTGNEINVRRREVFDFSRSLPATNHLSMLDALDIDDENLKCFLVDTAKIQGVLLIENKDEAERVLLADNSHRIASVICFIGNSALRISKFNGSLQADPVNPTRFRNPNQVTLRVAGDNVDASTQIEHDIDEIDVRIRRLRHEQENSMGSLQREMRGAKEELQRISHKYKELRAAISQATRKMEDMEGGTAKLESLQEQKAGVVDMIKINAEQVRGLQEDQQKAAGKVRHEKEVLMEAVRNYKELEKEYNELKKQVTQAVEELEDTKANVREYGEQITKSKLLIDKIKKFAESDVPALIADTTAQAEAICSKEEANLGPDDTVELVDRQIKQITESLARLEQEVGITRSEAAANLTADGKHYLSVKKKLAKCAALQKQLRSAAQSRLSNLESLATGLILSVSDAFEKALRLRNYQGKLDFDFVNSLLTLNVSTKPNEALRSVESFSGGEKSYAQISFLLSIWDVMLSRVRGLDEFDVFMDQINRRIALKLILNKVRENPKMQTIFITPLAIGNIDGLDDSSVSIHEITPPARASNTA